VGVAVVLVGLAAAGQVVGSQDGVVVGIGGVNATEIGVGVAGQRSAGGIDAGRVVGGVDDAELVVLAQESLRVVAADLDVVDALHVGQVGVDTGVRQGALLRDRGGLDGAEIGERVVAGVVVVEVLTHVGAEVEDGVSVEDAGVGGGDVEGLDLG